MKNKTGNDLKPTPIPITVVAGFLGAGKTTLLNHILSAEHGRRIGVLVNDFGSINVDAELITEVGDGVVSLANGCICCSIRMDLIRAVLQLAGLPDRPEHIVIESSGVADPAGIVTSFLEPGIWDVVRLDGVITVVDAEQSLNLPEEEMKLARAQVAGGDLIALNKVDLVDTETLKQVHQWIDGIRPGVQVFETTQCRLPMEILLGKSAAKTERGDADTELGVHTHEVSTSKEALDAHDHSHHDQHHDLMFDTWTFTSTTPMHLELIRQLLGHLPSTLFRIKGFVHAVEEPQSRMVLQLVGRRATISPTRSWGDETPQTRLVFIGRHATVNFAAIEKALKNCQTDVATP
jgi:G3E family GTPase